MKGDKKAAYRQQIKNNMKIDRQTKGVITSQTKTYDCADHNQNGYNTCAPTGGDGDRDMFNQLGGGGDFSGKAIVTFGSKLPDSAFNKTD